MKSIRSFWRRERSFPGSGIVIRLQAGRMWIIRD